MTKADDPKAWIGKTRSLTEIIDTKHAGLLAVTLAAPAREKGDPLPACWQWGWFNDGLPAGELGRDGHPKKGGFLPPVDLPRRMWAGGEMEFLAPILIGQNITKTSTIEDVAQKTGKSGKLCIVTLRHDYRDGETLCLREKQNLVYREDPAPNAPTPSPLAPPDGAMLSHEIDPNPVLMFRYSALTFNGHRIHYDADYARDVEGYPGIVFHAPLTATFLCTLAQEMAGENEVATFRYRATAPLFSGTSFSIRGKEKDGELIVWAETPSGGLAMQASATLR